MTDERPNDYDIFHEVPPLPAGTREWMKWYGLTDADIQLLLEDPTAPPLPGSPVARRAEYLAKIRKAAAASAPPKAKPEVAAPAAEPVDDEKAWISVTEALNRLPFIKGGIPALYKYAKQHPGELRLRPHPQHKRRRQANAADVLRLEMEYDGKVFEALDRPAADVLPSFSSDGLKNLTERMQRIKADKRKK